MFLSYKGLDRYSVVLAEYLFGVCFKKEFVSKRKKIKKWWRKKGKQKLYKKILFQKEKKN